MMRVLMLEDGPFPMEGPTWHHMSAVATDFISRCLAHAPNQCMAADRALVQLWLHGLRFSKALVPPQAVPPPSLRFPSTLPSTTPVRMQSRNRIQATSTLANPAETGSSRAGSPHTPFVSPAGAATNASGMNLPVLPGHV